VAQLLGWVRWLPSELLLEHPSLPAAGAFASALLVRPEVDVQRLLAVAERSRRERPELWMPHVEAVVEVTRSLAIERGDVGAAVVLARRAVAAAAAGADSLSVGVLAILAHALFFAGELDESRQVAVQAVERPDAPDRPEGYVVSLGLLALLNAEQGRAEAAEVWARQAISFARTSFHADSWRVSLAHRGLALACAATGRLQEAEREALRGESLRRSPQPTVGHAHALLVLAQVPPRAITARARRRRPQPRAKGDWGVSRSGAAPCARGEGRAGSRRRPSECRKRSRCRAAQRGRARGAAVPSGRLSRREIGARL